MPTGQDEKRARILQAAYEVCEQHGVEAARMEEVAARARVSKGTLYRYFDSREHLLLATILDSYERSLPLLPDLPEAGGADPAELLRAHVDVLVKVLEEVTPRMNVHYQAWGLVAKTPELRERLHAFLRDFHVERGRELAAVVRAGQAAGVFRKEVPPVAVAEGMQALLSGFLYRANFDPESAQAPLLRRCLEALVNELVRPARARAGGADV
ncbi:MAG: TetR/AcrR family transcriptional regulator [Myxococcota bacterium]